MDDYNLFKTYVALKSHFTTDDYDFIRYGGKCKITEKAYQKRKDVKSFRVVAGWLPQKLCVPFLVSHFVDLTSFNMSFVMENPAKSQKIFNRWKERTKDVLEAYRTDLRTIAVESNYSWRDCITQRDEDYPLLFKMVMSGRITPETYSMLDSLFHFTNKDYKGMDTDVMFLSLNVKYRKYRRFLAPSLEDLLRETPRDLTIYRDSSIIKESK